MRPCFFGRFDISVFPQDEKEEEVKIFEREALAEYHLDLDDAETSVSNALEALTVPFGLRRGVWYRFRLRRAQKALKRCLRAESKGKPSVNPHGEHEWECLGGAGGWEIWGCHRCGREAMPALMGFTFYPDIFRRLPGRLGARWRCDD